MYDFSFFSSSFYKEKPILTAKKIVAWKKKNNLYNFKTIPNTVILSAIHCFSKKDLFLKKKYKGLNVNAVKINNILYVTDFGNGAPAIVSLMEELKELGAKKIIFFGYAGILDESINSGEFFNVNSALSFNGTSFFYLNEKQIEYTNNFQLQISSFLNIKNTNAVSIDAPFRESKSFLGNLKKKSISLIDMETASVLAFGKFYKIKVCSILAASDKLLPEWLPPENTKKIRQKTKEFILKLTKEI